MMVRHATWRKNLPSIREYGLSCRYSKGARRRVWFHEPNLSAWAVLHVCNRRLGRAGSVAVLELDIPDYWLHWWSRGLWYCDMDIHRDLILRVVPEDEYDWQVNILSHSPGSRADVERLFLPG
jgi:hypothetical protein